MNRSRELSDERLSAFVDGELDADERETILAAVAADPELAHRLCELRATKELLRHAYDPLPRPGVRHRRDFSRWSGALAAGIMLVVGIAVGWQGHRHVAPSLAIAQAGTAQPTHILIHLDSSTEERMEEALDIAEAYLAKVGHAHVEVVVNNSGIDLLRQETSPYAQRIAALSSRHEMLSFVACGYAISRYRSSGRTVTLLPSAQVAETAVAHIVDRVGTGWTYVKI